MGRTQYLIDTNAVIELLKGHLPSKGDEWLENIVGENLHHLSVINKIELLGFNGVPAEMQLLEDFIAASNVLPLTEAVVRQTIDIRRTYKIKLPDAVIAATALVHGLTMISRNLSDFERINGLTCVNAHDV